MRKGPAGPAFSANDGDLDAILLSNRKGLALTDSTGVLTPEPGTLLLLPGLGGIMMLRRRR